MNVTAQKAIADLDLLERIAREDFLWYGTDRYGHVDRTGGKKREGVGERYLREGGRLSTLRIIMGHSSVSTTVDLYAHLDLSDARTDVLLLDTVSL